MKKNNQINIFIVEDNKVFSLALKADLETSFPLIPIKVHTFDTGEACIEKFKEVNPQVVILDYNLNSMIPSAMDGSKVLMRIKREKPETYVIMLTAIDNIDISIQSFRNGAFDYVVKTETVFKRINNSLFHLMKFMEAKDRARKYKQRFIAICLCIAVLAGGLIAILLFAPEVLSPNSIKYPYKL